MKKHYRVQSVLLSANKTVAVTMLPVEWVRPDGPAVDEDGYPVNWRDCEPSEPEAEPFEPGGSKTELRFKSTDQMFLPDEFVTLTIERTEHGWTPGN